METNAENGYYLVKWTSESYTFQSTQFLGKYFITAGELMCDAVYLNPLAYFKHWYNIYENKNLQKQIVTLNTIILTKGKV